MSAANEARYNVLTLCSGSGDPMSHKIDDNLIQGQSIHILEHGFDIVLSLKLSEEFICAALSDIPHR